MHEDLDRKYLLVIDNIRTQVGNTGAQHLHPAKASRSTGRVAGHMGGMQVVMGVGIPTL